LLYSELKSIYSYNSLSELIEAINSTKENLSIKGLKGSARGLIFSRIIESSSYFYLFILSDKDEAAYFFNDLINIIGDEVVFFFPTSYKRSIQYFQPDAENILLRTQTLQQVNKFKESETNKKSIAIITYPEALCEKVITKNQLKSNTLTLKKNEDISISFIEEVLDTYNFKLVDFVVEPGQYSIRGSLVDIFSFSSEWPFRIDFFGNTVESIKSFDIETQLSKTEYNEIDIVPNIQDIFSDELRVSILDFISENSIIVASDLIYTIQQINSVFNNTNIDEILELNESNTKISKNEILISGDEFYNEIEKFRIIEFSNQTVIKNTREFFFNTSLQPIFNKNFEFLANDLLEKQLDGYINYILSDNPKQIERLTDIFKQINSDIRFTPINSTLHEGFIDHDNRICVYTDHQIFERYHRYKIKKYYFDKSTITLNEIFNLQPGDYIVHIDHGIGRFGGLETIEINGRKQEAVRLVYKDNDILYVGIHSLHKISKYKSKDGETPKIYKLGTGAWQKLKQNTKSKLKDIAKELIALYAKRKAEKGFAFSPDSYLQTELEASFFYEDTPDQEKATRLVKQAMESEMPMDMLVCGDVGFGKTEVAIRAAFKAVADNKQVAVLVPTTILAFQHYNTFSDRLKNFPCRIEFLSRFKNSSEQKKIINELAEGKIDIIIGTHRLVSKDIKFKDLGLLIIDEEQKFGVSIKEKLRQIRINVDTLTLTATPIPRTLQFSLMGIREFAVINTPPPNRHPIFTEVHTFNEEIIKEAIINELERDGQVFFIHNRIQNINEIADLIRRLVPYSKPVVAHGQMTPHDLEQIMIDFIDGKYDVLVSTAIIESGLDIPNANTIIINDAHNFGLSDLHQLRGRVGRSNRRAFCYLLAPPLTTLTNEARRRLKAIVDFSDLGSGFNIALQDLDIRGAGNLLGAEQSGFIADVGFETYQRILEETLQELKETEFNHLYKDEFTKTESLKFVSDCQIETDFEVLFPEKYISSISERIKLYRELDNIENQEQLDVFITKLIDRFGRIPAPTIELLNIVKLRWKAVKLGFEKIIMKNNAMTIYFIANEKSPYYQSPLFTKVLQVIQQKPKNYQLKESKRLTLTIVNIKNVEDAIKAISVFEID